MSSLTKKITCPKNLPFLFEKRLIRKQKKNFNIKMAGKPIHIEAFSTLSKSLPMRLKQLRNYLEDSISIVK